MDLKPRLGWLASVGLAAASLVWMFGGAQGNAALLLLPARLEEEVGMILMAKQEKEEEEESSSASEDSGYGSSHSHSRQSEEDDRDDKKEVHLPIKYQSYGQLLQRTLRRRKRVAGIKGGIAPSPHPTLRAVATLIDEAPSGGRLPRCLRPRSLTKEVQTAFQRATGQKPRRKSRTRPPLRRGSRRPKRSSDPYKRKQDLLKTLRREEKRLERRAGKRLRAEEKDAKRLKRIEEEDIRDEKNVVPIVSSPSMGEKKKAADSPSSTGKASVTTPGTEIATKHYRAVGSSHPTSTTNPQGTRTGKIQTEDVKAGNRTTFKFSNPDQAEAAMTEPKTNVNPQDGATQTT